MYGHVLDVILWFIVKVNLTIRKKNIDVRVNNTDDNCYELTDINRIFLKLHKLLDKVNYIKKSILALTKLMTMALKSIADQVQNCVIKINLLESKYTNTLNTIEVLESKINEN